MDKIFTKIHEICGKFIKNEKLMEIIRKVISKEVVSYLFFGVMTTVVNFIAFGLCEGKMHYLVANAVAWVAAVIFAFVTNKLFVFDSKSWKPNVLFKEAASFTGARLLTLGIEEIGMWGLIDLLHLDKAFELSFISGEMVVKIIISIVVVILNYFFSKMIIFKKK